jgi:nitronate monooxygenase
MCAAPMFLVSSPELVIAACEAGIMGAFPAPNARAPGELEAWMEKIAGEVERVREIGDRPFGPWAVNLVTHSTNSRLPEDLKLVARYRPPVVITALGSPRPVVETVHSYGGLVFADVITPALAKKALQAGADGLVCVCAGAGGHTGFLSLFSFVSAVREFFDGPLIAGGGIADGWGVAGAIAAGADIAYVGTRFIATEESVAVAEHKKLVVAAEANDLIVSAAISGTPASWLKESIRNAGLDPDNLVPAEMRNYDSNAAPKKRWSEIFAAGQGVARCRTIESVAQVVSDMDSEYRAALKRLSGFAERVA